jgi:Exoribonuclease Xrn1 D1 domain
MRNLEIAKVSLLPRNMRGTKFEIPQIYIDDQRAKEIDLDALAKEFVLRKRDAVYIDYPFKHEAFIYSITTVKEHYNVYNCWEKKTTKNLVTETTDQQWFEASNYVSRDLLKYNVHVSNWNTIVGFNRVIGLEWNPNSNSYEKQYKIEVEYLPLPMISLDRDEGHYLELGSLINDPLKRFETLKK